jgi:hypothetical protein
MPEEAPAYRRPIVLISVGVAAMLAALGIGGFAWLHSTADHSRLAVPAVPAAAGAGGVVTVVTPTPAAPPTTDVPAPTTTSATTTTTTTTTTRRSTTPPPSASGDALLPTGRVSGTIASKNGDTWTISTWYGSQETIQVTGATQRVAAVGIIPHDEFAVGQTVNIFWHSVGQTMVADSVYGN